MVRSVFGGSTSEATPDLLDAGLRDTFDKTAERYGVPVNVLRAVAESRKANGPRGERGGRRIGVMGLDTRDYLATGVNALDPAAAIDAEAQTLKAALDGAKGDVPGAVRAKYGEAADDVLARAARLADEYPSADPKALGTATGQIEDKGVLDRTAQGVNLMTGGFIKGVGDAVQGAGDVGAFIEDNFDKSAEDIYARGMLGQPEPAPREEAPNRLVETAQGIREVGQNVQDRGAPDFIEPMKKSVPSGVWYDPSTWSLGDDPSVEGYLAHGLSVFGESLATLASAWMSGPLTAATVGGLQGAGGADQMARDQIDAWNAQGNLVFRSKVYRDMLMAGVPHAEALAKTKEGAAKWAAALDAPLAAVGGYVTGKLVDPATKILSGQGVLTRAVGRGVIAGVEESIQEVAESTAAGTGFNIGAGAKRDISEGTFADAILSFLPGFVPGAAAGALSRREEVSRETPPPTLGGEPPPSSGDGVPPSGEDATTMPVTETPVSPPPAPKTRGKRAKKVEDAAAPNSPPEATADEDGVIEEITPAPGKTPLSDAYKEQPTRGRFAPGQKVFVTTGGKTRNGVVQEHDDGGFVWADEDGVTVDVPQELLDNGEVRVRLDVPPGTPDRPVPPGGAAPAAPAKGLGSLEEAEARLQYVRDQARGGGWTAPLLRARKEAEAAIKRFKGRANAAGAAPDRPLVPSDRGSEQPGADGAGKPAAGGRNAGAPSAAGASAGPLDTDAVTPAGSRGEDGADNGVPAPAPGALIPVDTADGTAYVKAADYAARRAEREGQHQLYDAAGNPTRKVDWRAATTPEDTRKAAASQSYAAKGMSAEEFEREKAAYEAAKAKRDGKRALSPLEQVAGMPGTTFTMPTKEHGEQHIKDWWTALTVDGRARLLRAIGSSGDRATLVWGALTENERAKIAPMRERAGNEPASPAPKAAETNAAAKNKDGYPLVGDKSQSWAAGESAFLAGKPRQLPSNYTKSTGPNARDWFRGWDAANLAAPMVPEGYAVDPPVWIADGTERQLHDGAYYSAVARRLAPFSAEKGYGNTPHGAQIDALRRLGVKADRFGANAPLAKDEHPGLVIKSLATGKEETIQPVGTKPPPKGGTNIGTNASGHALYEDENSVRSYVVGGIRITESVNIIPGRGISVDKGARGRDFLTAGEWRDKQAATSTNVPSNEGAESDKATNPRALVAGDVIRLTKEVGYATGNETYTVEYPTKRGVALRSASGSATDVTHAMLAGNYEIVSEAPPKGGKRPSNEAAAKPAQFAANTLFTQDKVDAARARLKAKLRNQLNAGLDPEMLGDGLTLAGAYVESGIRSFAAFAKAMVEDLGPAIRPYLLNFWNGIRGWPGLDTDGMTSAATAAEQHAEMMRDAAESANIAGERTDDVPGENQEAPADLPADEGEGAEGGGAVRGDGAGEGEGRAGEGDGASGPRVSSTRGRGGRSGRNRVRGSRAGRGRMGKAGADEAGAGVSGPDEAADGASGRVDAPNIPAVNFKITDEARLGQGTEGEKFRDNIEAIRILKQLEADGGRRATAEEQNRLARYVGWGGMANAFASPTTGEFKPDWKKRGEELRDLLTDEEYRQARRSTPNAHYTSETVVKAMWRAAERLGFKGGLALETSMGTGNFIGLMPESAAAKFIGIEYDSVTARIAAALYPASAVYHTGFHKVPLPDNTFALAIGNPPFGKNSLRFQYRPELAGVSIHNQFFRAAMDAVRPGGLQIMVVSRYLMDAKDGTSRRALAHDADLVAAIRLPDTAFKENARTEVVTDIIILKKLGGEAAKERADAFAATTEKPERERDKEQARQARAARIPDWVNTTEIDDPLGGAKITVNSYFAANPGQIIGTLERSGSMAAGEDVTVRLGAAVERGKMTQAERDAHDAAVAAEMAARLNAAVDRLPENIHSLDAEVMAATEARFKSLADGLRIALGGLEPGHIAIDADGKLTRIIEQETPEGQLQFSKQALTAESPWSEQLSQDDKGRWYRMVETFDEKGVKRKVLDEQGRPTRSNLYERQTFENEADVPPTLRLGAAKFEKLKALVRLRDTLKRQLVLESTDAAESLQEENRARLRKGYEAFVAKHGPVNRLTNIAIHASMPDSGLISALEVKYEPERSKEAAEKAGLDPQPETVVPAPILTSRVVPKYVPVTSAANATDALSITLSEFGRVNLDRMAQLTGKSPDEVTTELQKGEKPLIYFDPEEGEWQTADAYLSGLVRRKLEAAREAGLEKNIAALEPIQPKPWTADKVTALLGSTWVPTKHYEAFVQHLLGGRATVRFYPLTNLFTVETHGASDPEQWRTEDASAEWLVTRILNSQKIVVFDVDRDGNKHVNHDGTALANIKAEEIRNEFADWVYKDSDRRNELVDIFNDKFNVRVNRQHDGSHLTLVGKNPNIQMRRHQNNAIWRGISERFMLVDHVVGAGKTFTAIGRAMERRRMGLSKKPMIVVPNHLVEQWESDVYRLYPGAKVLAAGKKDFDPKRRRRLFAKIATGDWDIVIVPHSSFGFIGISPETEQRYLDAEYQIALEAVKEAEDQAAANGFSGRGKPLGVKQAEALVAAIEARLDKLREGARDRLLTFEQMGVDDLTIDEAHEFKNLFYTSKMSEARGMGPRAGSRKAADLYNKVRVIRETKTGTVTFMTGTPISNSAVEMYTMMRYLAADQLKDQGLEHFDAWRVQYVDASTAFEPNDSGGGLKEVSRLGRNWANMRSLMDLYYQFTDAVTNDDIKRWYKEDTGLDFPIPAIKGGERQLVKVEPTPAQVDWLLQLISDFDDLPNIADPNARNAERLRLMDRARKISLDIRAVEPTHPSKEEGGKLDQVADNVKRIYAASTPDKGTQLIFVDRGVPRSRGDDKIIASYDRVIARRDAALQKGDEAAYEEALEDLEKFNANEIEELRIAQRGGWNAYAQIKKNLIARGVPEKEIRFVQEADNDEQKAALFEAVRQGKVRVLLGSTPKMGAGTNVQDRLVALHHVDVTWKPSDIEQREGRIIRQGNLFATPTLPDGSANPMFKPGFEAEILAYATERTVDAKMWTLNATKLRMINGIRKYDGEFTMEFEDEESASMAEMAAMATGDVRLIERVQLESAINKLALHENAHRRKLWGMQGEFERAQKTLEQAAPTTARETAFRDMLAAGLKEREAHYAGRSIEVEGKRFAFTDRTKAAEAVEGAIGEAQAAILAQRGPEGKGRYSVNIGGRQFTNEESIINAIEEALGDVTPFLAEIGGRKYGSRTLAARAIAHTVSQRKGNVPAAVGEEVIVPLGSYLGVPLTAGMWRTVNQKGAPAIEVYLMLGEDRQRRIAESKESTFHSDLEWSTSAAKSLLDDIDRRAGYRASGAALRDTLGDIDRAKATIEELKDKAHEPFPKAEEISQKRARLKELIAELDTSTPRANAAHHGQAPDDTDDTDDDIAHAQTAPAGWEVVEPTPQKRFTAAEVDAGLRKGPLGRIIGKLIDDGTLMVQDTFQGNGQYMAGTLRGYAATDGRIAVIANNALSIDEARRTVLHEAFHAGVRGLLGRREFDALIDRMRQIVGGAVDRMAANQGKGPPSDAFWADMWATVRNYPLEHMFEEAAAFAINNVDRAPSGLKETINRIIGMVKAWVLARFGKQIGEVTPQQLRALAILAIRDRWRPGVEHKMEHYADLGLIRAQIDTEPTPSPEDDRRADLTLRERIAAATTEAMAPALATIPLRPLLSEMGRGIPAFGKYLDAKQGMDAMRNEWHAKIDALAQSWLKFRVFNRHANTALMDLMHMSTIADVDPTRPFESYMTADDHETLRRPRRENDVPDIAWDIARNKQRTDQRRREAYPGLRRQYDALPADAKTLYGETRDMLRELADEQERLIIENARNALENGVREAEREHSRRILEIDEEGLTGRARAQAIAQADEDLHYARNEGRWVRRNRIRELRKKLEKNRIKGPYFPLARFGDYFVTVRDEEDRVESFSKFESRAEQLRFTKELEAEGVDPERVSIGVMSQAEQVRAQVDPQFVADVVEILRESGTDRVLEDAIWQSYLERLPDMSIRKARIHRKGRAGFNEDALRSFANHMFHGAHQNARLKYVPDLAEWLEVAREEARAVNDDEGQIRAELLVNELEHRHAYILNPAGSPLAQTLTQAGFIWHIAMSPASAAVNLSQTFTLGIPALASNHAGAGNGTAESTALAIKELGRAMKDFTFASRPVRTLRQRLGRAIDAAPGMEHSGRLDVDEKAAMHEFYALGLGDRTQGHDLAGIAETGIQYSALRASVMAKVSWAFHKAEVFNREVTFLAAYRMARQRGLDHPLAIDDAAKVTWKAHFDYQNTSRPRIMQGNTARVLLLFKNYSVNMLFRLIWDTKQAFNGKITPDERREAKIQLFGTTMALMAIAGIRGTWVMAVVLPLLFGLVFGAGDDDDTSLGEVAIAPLTLLKRLAFGADDHDAEVMRRELMEVLPSWIVGPIMDGMPGYVTGTDLAERVGSGDLWFRAPDRVLEGEDAVAYWLEQILGPVIGIGVNAGKFVFDPPDNLERGFETVLPKALRDIVRAGRYMIDGAETMKGEPIVEDMSPGQWVAQALGFMPAQLAERYRQNSVSKNREKAIMDRRSGLLDDIWEHVGADEEVPQSVWDDIAAFNAQYPDYPINGKSIKASIAGHQRARANNSGGIVLNQKIERRILEEAAPGTYD